MHHATNSTSALHSAINSTGREAGLRGTNDRASSESGAAAGIVLLAASSHGEKGAPDWRSLAVLSETSLRLNFILAV